MKIAVVCANGKALAELREITDVKWTFISYADYAIAMVDGIIMFFKIYPIGSNFKMP